MMAYSPSFSASVPTMRSVSSGKASRASLRRLASGAGPVPGGARLPDLSAVAYHGSIGEWREAS